MQTNQKNKVKKKKNYEETGCLHSSTFAHKRYNLQRRNSNS